MIRAKNWSLCRRWVGQALKEEIQRVLELEAENAVLQESLATLPQLRKDRMAFLKLQEHFQVPDCWDFLSPSHLQFDRNLMVIVNLFWKVGTILNC